MNIADMLYDVSRDEAVYHKLLIGYILNVANIKSAFLRISTNSETNRAFCKAYNGSQYEANKYHIKLANAMK